jgi:hypothetical protein
MTFIRGGEVITVRRRSTASTDDYGNPTYTISTFTIQGALVAFGSTDEPVDAGRNAIDNQITVYIPRGTQIQDDDVFQIRNSTWVKDGDPQDWVSPFSGLDGGIVLNLRKRDG